METSSKKNIIEVGLDEVARGCMFGRVYTAAVIWPQDYSEDKYDELLARDDNGNLTHSVWSKP